MLLTLHQLLFDLQPLFALVEDLRNVRRRGVVLVGGCTTDVVLGVGGCEARPASERRGLARVGRWRKLGHTKWSWASLALELRGRGVVRALVGRRSGLGFLQLHLELVAPGRDLVDDLLHAVNGVLIDLRESFR